MFGKVFPARCIVVAVVQNVVHGQATMTSRLKHFIYIYIISKDIT